MSEANSARGGRAAFASRGLLDERLGVGVARPSSARLAWRLPGIRAPREFHHRCTAQGIFCFAVSDSLQLTIVYEQGEDGWIIASVPKVPGALSQGCTRAEARENVIDALRLILSPAPGDLAGDREPLQLTIAP